MNRFVYLLYTTCIHMQRQNTSENRQIQYRHKQVGSVVQVRTVLLTSDFGSSTRGDRHNSYYADHTIWPHQCVAHLAMSKTSICRDPKNLTAATTVENSTLCPSGRNSIVCLHGPISTLNWLFFKILKFSGPSLPGMTLSTLQPHFLSGVYYDNGDCHILYARA